MLTICSLAKNVKGSGSGGITPDTYIAFMTIEAMAYVSALCPVSPHYSPSLTILSSLPFAFLISPLENVVRSDGTRIRMMPRLSSRQELKQIKTTITSKLIMLSFLWAIWSFFYR